MKRLGRYTLLFERRPAILGHAAMCGKKEAAGPLARDFDQTFLARRGFKSRTLTWYLREIC